MDQRIAMSLTEARRDHLEALRQLRIATASTNPEQVRRALDLAIRSVLDAGVEVTWCLYTTGNLSDPELLLSKRAAESAE